MTYKLRISVCGVRTIAEHFHICHNCTGGITWIDRDREISHESKTTVNDDDNDDNNGDDNGDDDNKVHNNEEIFRQIAPQLWYRKQNWKKTSKKNRNIC